MRDCKKEDLRQPIEYQIKKLLAVEVETGMLFPCFLSQSRLTYCQLTLANPYYCVET